MSSVQEFQLEDAHFKFRKPKNDSPGTNVILMLHGYSGDESSMWAFDSQIPENALVVTVRAPFDSKDAGIGGYSWVDQPLGYWPVYQDFFPAVEILKGQLSAFADKFPQANFEQLTIVGFSQGGAMAVVFANMFAGNVQKLAILSGFLPDSSEGFLSQERFSNLKVFIAHGKKDTSVSVDLARYAAEEISNLGSKVIYCEAEVGHQLGSDCFKAFGKFLGSG